MERETRVLQQSKQKATSVKATGNPDLKELTEGVPKLMYLKGSGLYWVTKYNNQLYYNQFSTSR